MEFLMDPSIWIGLLTLVVLEIVLGIDNLVFIAILADKLPPAQRDKARLIGLSLALLMRLGLLSVISWMVTLTAPLFALAGHDFSGRDLILILGGLFLLFKATMELHERLEGVVHENSGSRVYAGFWVVVAQIVALDAVFSLDAVITAVGMVDNLGVMMVAVMIAMAVMLLASKPLTRFVNAHPTVVVLCLSFLLMIGLSLVAEGFGFHIPKGYLYAAIGFSILIEAFNQVARRNFVKHESRRPMRERTAEAILRMMGSRRRHELAESAESESSEAPVEAFGDEERYMISGVLTLADRSIRTIMTPRTEVSWVDCNGDPHDIRQQLLDTPHSLFPVCRGTLDEVVGVARAKDLLVALDSGQSLAHYAAQHSPIVVPESMDAIKLLGVLRRAKGRFVLVTDEFGVVQGLVTPLDVLEAIAGEFPDEDETLDIVRDDAVWLVKGGADLHMLEQALGDVELVSANDEYASLAGLLLVRCGHMPALGETLDIGAYRFEVAELSERRIELVRIRMIEPALSDPH
ncbi:TerC family protein [Crenobacter cavernae]|uniref:TerC family protein n=1 Tax=Crenobacter cavernae TaxID=2290923 RepID=A0A345Y3B5_9NEIS|nr:TerC family protein [Crenobacter cavernae]AXK38417.1 TerC family protein [Crenobacter cavernae]